MSPQAGLQLPHDIEGLLIYGFPWMFVGGIALAAIVATLLAIWLFRYWQNKRNAPPVEPKRDPLKEALAELARLAVPEPLSRKAGIDFCYQATLLFREILEIVTGIAVTDMTVGEIKRSLKTGVLPSSIPLTDLVKRLEMTDFVKFAERDLTRIEAKDLVDTLLGWGRLLSEQKQGADDTEGAG